MIKKKAVNKTAGKKSAKKSAKKRPKKEMNPADLRKQVSQIVQSEAVDITQAVVEEALKGQVAPVRYLFEMANIFPAQTDPEQATEEEDCLAKILLSRIEAPAKPEKEDIEEPETAEERVIAPAGNEAGGTKKAEEQAAVGIATAVT